MKRESKKALFLTLIDPRRKKRVERNIRVVEQKGYKVDVICPFAISGESYKTLPFDTAVNKASKSANKLDLIFLYVKQIWYAISKTIFNIDTSEKYAHSISGYTYRDLLKNIDTNYALIIVEEIELLPIALYLNTKSGKIGIDLRDFYWRDDTLQNHLALSPIRILLNNLAWAHHVMRKAIYKSYLNRADFVLTVCEGHQKEVKKLLDINTVVLRSTAQYYPDLKPVFKDMGELIHLVYHGAAYRRRGLDLLIEAVNQTSINLLLHLYLTDPDDGFLDELKSQSSDKIQFHSPVSPDELVNTMNEYDVGIIFYPPYDSSLEHSLPNKFFEYIQSRLAVISGPSFDMSKIINSYEIGTVSDSFQTEDLTRSLNGLNHDKLNDWKMNTNMVAKKLSFENEVKKFSQLI